MKKYFPGLFLLLLVLSGCESRYHYPLSVFRLNGKIKNAAVRNRVPQWGDGQRDGCIVVPEISLDVTITGDTLKGKVMDTETRDGLIASQIELKPENGQIFSLFSDSKGEFFFRISGKLQSIHVKALGYRELNIYL